MAYLTTEKSYVYILVRMRRRYRRESGTCVACAKQCMVFALVDCFAKTAFEDIEGNDSFQLNHVWCPGVYHKVHITLKLCTCLSLIYASKHIEEGWNQPEQEYL